MKIMGTIWIVFVGLHLAVFETLFCDEWKETCRSIIDEIETDLTDCKKMIQHLNDLTEKIGEQNFLCPTNESKPNCKFNKSNSFFLYSLNEATRYCEDDKNDGQNSDNKQNDSKFELVKMFVGQFRDDFYTFVIDIGLMDIGENSLMMMTKEKVQKMVDKLDAILEGIKEKEGFYDEDSIRSKANDESTEAFCYGDAVKTAQKELDELLEKDEEDWENSDSDFEVQQVLIKMIVKIKSKIYENDLNRKTAFLKDDTVNGKGLIALSNLFREKFEQIRKVMGYDKGDKETNITTLKQLAKKTTEKGVLLRKYKKTKKEELNALMEKANKPLSILQEEANKNIINSKMKKTLVNVRKLRDELRPEYLSFFEKAEDRPNLTIEFIENELKSAITKFLKQILGIDEMEAMENEISKTFRIKRSDASIMEEIENPLSPNEI